MNEQEVLRQVVEFEVNAFIRPTDDPTCYSDEKLLRIIRRVRECCAKEFDAMGTKDPNEWLPPMCVARMIRGTVSAERMGHE